MKVLESRKRVPGDSPPAACPSWCGVKHPVGKGAHFSAQAIVPNPRPLPDEAPVLLRAELYQDADGLALMFVQGETTLELAAPGADDLIGQVQAFLDHLRLLRTHMG
ncbi:DUF6907 domain-containing protein [Streptomyces zhihengii]